jgi:hypothetical protein
LKVYLGCEYGGYSGYIVNAVFLTREKAEEWLKEKLKPYKSCSGLNIITPREGTDAWIEEMKVIE